MSRYAADISRKSTHQSLPVPGKLQVQNSAGGFGFEIDCWARLERFLILGNQGGSYYATQPQMTRGNAAAVLECAAADAPRTIRTIVDISSSGRAPKNDPAIFALALLAGEKQAYSPEALRAMPAVCRTSTHLFQFVATLKQLRGWGRSVRSALALWYTSRAPRDVAFQMTKYQQREGWSHRDVLRIAHPRASGDMNRVLQYAAQPEDFARAVAEEDNASDAVQLLQAVEQAKSATTPAEIVRLINGHNLVRECIPTELLHSCEVWEALLQKMPMTAMLRNLGKMSSIGLLSPLSSASHLVCQRLTDTTRLLKSRLHPLSVLVALATYEQGRGMRGSLKWDVNPAIAAALNDAFYLAFKNIEPTGKRHLLALDVSGSMGWGRIAGSPLTPRVASVAMALATMRTEMQTHLTAFSDHLTPVTNIGRNTSLKKALQITEQIPMGGTDCAKPMLYAMKNRLKVDTFVVYTDSETWAGKVHPFQAIKQYRQKMDIGAKLIVVGMVANKISIADPDDAGMLDIVGFDTAAPSVMADFTRQ